MDFRENETYKKGTPCLSVSFKTTNNTIQVRHLIRVKKLLLNRPIYIERKLDWLHLKPVNVTNLSSMVNTKKETFGGLK